MKRKILLLLLASVLVLAVITSCAGFNSMKDGYYTAEMSEYSHGWKEYLRIQVKNGTIVSAEFNAKNKSGFRENKSAGRLVCAFVFSGSPCLGVI